MFILIHIFIFLHRKTDKRLSNQKNEVYAKILHYANIIQIIRILGRHKKIFIINNFVLFK